MAPLRRDRRRAAFEQFVAEGTEAMLRTAYLVTGDAGHAEDLVQETLFQVARRWARVVSMESPHAYARRILVNLALDSSERRARHRHELEAPAPADRSSRWEPEVSSGVFATADERIGLVRALGELPIRQRVVLVLRYFDDLSESEVASMLGCPVGTVKSTAFRALEKMRELVPRGGPPLEPAIGFLACSKRKGE